MGFFTIFSSVVMLRSLGGILSDPDRLLIGS
jgi:hypothetical protein